jgi:hypothetical protein
MGLRREDNSHSADQEIPKFIEMECSLQCSQEPNVLCVISYHPELLTNHKNYHLMPQEEINYSIHMYGST